MTEHQEKYANTDEPPVFQSWTTWYAIVLGNLVLLITLFFAFTKYFD